MQYLVGVDEAGRGPLAGPVAVGAVLIPASFDFELVRGVRDSKQLSPEARETWYRRIRELNQSGLLSFGVSFSSAVVIDEQGIVPAIRSSLSRVLKRVSADPATCEVRLDGGLRAPAAYGAQRTIIRGDEQEPVISLASIVAKVLRDRYMRRLARSYPVYGFEVHKGYGTPSHRARIARFGFCPLHRTTFCTRLLAPSDILQNAEISV